MINACFQIQTADECNDNIMTTKRYASIETDLDIFPNAFFSNKTRNTAQRSSEKYANRENALAELVLIALITKPIKFHQQQGFLKGHACYRAYIVAHVF